MHRPPRSPLAQLSAVACVATIALLAYVAPGGASQLAPAAERPLPPEHVVTPDKAAPAARPGDPGLVEDRSRGVVFSDLEEGTAKGPCAGLLRARVDGPSICTHGPDPAPVGTDVGTPRSTADLAATTAESTAGVPCYGDGVSGKRVQAVYVRAADKADRYADVVGLIGQWAANVDQTFNDSAAETGGVRHVRWVTDAGCSLSVARVTLSTTGDDSFSATSSELSALGFNRTDRKYLLWVDANVYCGIAGIRGDDRATADNANNSGPSYARVDTPCWGATNPVEAHELMHNLGGVQNTAPRTSGGWHCTDEYDRMCYSDASGVTMSYVCASTHERLFDCNHDDFFSTAPTAGSYLATHWNAASSAFLESTEPATLPSTTTTPTTAPATTTPTTSPSTTTSTTAPPPTGTRSLTISGSLNRKTRSRSYGIVSGAGEVTVSASFTKASSLTLQLVAPDGTVVAQSSGSSPVRLSAQVAAGTSTLVVTGASGSSFTLTITYPAP